MFWQKEKSWKSAGNYRTHFELFRMDIAGRQLELRPISNIPRILSNFRLWNNLNTEFSYFNAWRCIRCEDLPRCCQAKIKKEQVRESLVQFYLN